MSSLNPLKRRVAALVAAQFQRTIEAMSDEELLDALAEMKVRRDAAMDARAKAKNETYSIQHRKARRVARNVAPDDRAGIG